MIAVGSIWRRRVLEREAPLPPGSPRHREVGERRSLAIALGNLSLAHRAAGRDE